MRLSACAATAKLAANERKMIAVRALAGTRTGQRSGRPLVYRQMVRRADQRGATTKLVDDIEDVLLKVLRGRPGHERAADRKMCCAIARVSSGISAYAASRIRL
jgi:hypothetical protein